MICCCSLLAPPRPPLRPRVWAAQVLTVIGEGFDAELSEDIAGLVLSTRRQADRISMWTKTSADEPLQKRIGYVRPCRPAVSCSLSVVLRCGPALAALLGGLACLSFLGDCCAGRLAAAVVQVWCVVALSCLCVPAGILTSGLALLSVPGTMWSAFVVSVLPMLLGGCHPLSLYPFSPPPRLYSLPPSLTIGLCLVCCREAWRATATPTGLHDNVQLEYLIHKDSIAKNSSYKNKARFVV